MEINLSALFAFVMFGLPLAITLWFMIKIINIRINAIRLCKQNRVGIEKEIPKIIVCSIIFLLIITLICYVVILAFAPSILALLPLSIKLILLIMLITISGCFVSLFLGLGDAFGAGGSATNVIKTLFSYICEAAEIDKAKNANKNNNIISEKKQH